MSTPKRKSAQIDLFKACAEMPKLFGDLIELAGFYEVLDNLAAACRSHADLCYSESAVKPVSMPEAFADGYQQFWEEKGHFFSEAAQNVELIRELLDSRWPKDALLFAGNDRHRFTAALQYANRKYFQSLVAKIADPNLSEDERRAARVELASNKGSIWIDRRTGKPSEELAQWFDGATRKLTNVLVSDEEKRDIIAALQELIKD